MLALVRRWSILRGSLSSPLYALFFFLRMVLFIHRPPLVVANLHTSLLGGETLSSPARHPYLLSPKYL